MTKAATVATIRALSPVLTAKWIAASNEYRVTILHTAYMAECGLSYTAAIEKAEAVAYYTDDADDAIGTARQMVRDFHSINAMATPTGTNPHKAALHIVQSAWLDRLEFIRQHGGKSYCSGEMLAKLQAEADALEASCRALGHRSDFDA
jgi:hypothetical protein